MSVLALFKSFPAALAIVMLLPAPAQATPLCVAVCSCTLSTTNIALPGYNPIDGSAQTGLGSVTASCSLLSGLISLLVPYTITLSKGASNSYAARQMAGPASPTLSYNLYLDAGLGTVWGDGTGISQILSTSILVSTVGANVLGPQSVYALIPPNQNVPVGSYGDTITATLSF